MSLVTDFLQKNNVNPQKARNLLKKMKKDKNGNIVLKQGMFVLSKTPIVNYAFTNSWILLLQPRSLNRQEIPGKMALIKSYISDKCPQYYDDTEKEMAVANNFILPEIAKQFQLEAADYYNVIFENCKELESEDNYSSSNYYKKKILPGKRYMLTPSFIDYDEELIHFADIVEPYELKATKMLSKIEEYLTRRNILETDIKAIKRNFIRQCIFNKYIDYTDEHNLNGGIILSQNKNIRRARLAPSYDLDFSGELYNLTNGGVQPTAFFRTTDQGEFDLLPMLEQFKGELKKEDLRDIISSISLDNAISIGQEYGNFKLTDNTRKKYNRFFKRQQKELEAFYKSTYGPMINGIYKFNINGNNEDQQIH